MELRCDPGHKDPILRDSGVHFLAIALGLCVYDASEEFLLLCFSATFYSSVITEVMGSTALIPDMSQFVAMACSTKITRLMQK